MFVSDYISKANFQVDKMWWRGGGGGRGKSRQNRYFKKLEFCTSEILEEKENP